ncbi:MAG: hypothetical protein EON48_18545 [Acetobacteraceae bacterium]|nr:MAG: hypothetical protein EON48_18545 [Acetobacteraceae bacterium]
MSPAEFEAWSTGKTLDYTVDGSLWGSEMHQPGRQTLDADVGGICRSGHWYPQGDAICFVYDLSPGPYCWRFLKDGDKVVAEYTGEPVGGQIIVTLSEAPVPCSPEVGV